MTEEPEYTSESGNQWVSDLIDEARNSNSLEAAGVLTRWEILLKGRISEQDLTPTELKTIATQLIGDMFPAPTEPGETQ